MPARNHASTWWCPRNKTDHSSSPCFHRSAKLKTQYKCTVASHWLAIFDDQRPPSVGSQEGRRNIEDFKGKHLYIQQTVGWGGQVPAQLHPFVKKYRFSFCFYSIKKPAKRVQTRENFCCCSALSRCC